jgi:xylan 1,4-beta-xylosidase
MPSQQRNAAVWFAALGCLTTIIRNELWGMPFPDAYMQLYNASALAVKSVDPAYKVGGPATAQLAGPLGGVAAFVNESTSRGIPFDFVCE